jgi:hypothetical protein
LHELVGLRNEHARMPLDSRDLFKSFSSRLPLARQSLGEGCFLLTSAFSSRPGFLILNSYFILSSLSAIFRALMQPPEKRAHQNIDALLHAPAT